jgi:phosphatidylethanolamine/phosphatidyl-N-methylethanolamine N-methyltransferase
MKSDSATIQHRYNRIAPYFDGLEAVMEGLILKGWREKCWQYAQGKHILEVGVGTGKNFPFYPDDARITAIDFSPAMLKQAEQKKHRKNIVVDLELMDVQSLYFADNCFDTVIATFVFCSVPLPLKGLKELYRVCRPGGQVVLLEHIISSKPVLASIMNALNPMVFRLVGANINRNTLKNVQACPFSSVHVDERSGDIIKLIVAKK